MQVTRGVKGDFVTFHADSPAELMKLRRALAGKAAYIERDMMATATSNAVSWGLNRIDQRLLPLDGIAHFPARGNGTGAHVYVLDTGLNTAHPAFAGRVGAGYDWVDDDSNPDDTDGHGEAAQVDIRLTLG